MRSNVLLLPAYMYLSSSKKENMIWLSEFLIDARVVTRLPLYSSHIASMLVEEPYHLRKRSIVLSSVVPLYDVIRIAPTLLISHGRTYRMFASGLLTSNVVVGVTGILGIELSSSSLITI